MRVSLSINTFSGTVGEKCQQAADIAKSSVHIDYSGDYELDGFLREVACHFSVSDMHVISEDPYSEMRALGEQELLPNVVFIQLENLTNLDFKFFGSDRFFPAIQVKSDLTPYEPLLEKSSRVLLMTTVPGVSGGVFDEGTFEVVEKVKKINPTIKVYVDGGVTADNFQRLRFLGVHTVIIGSYLAKSANWKRNFSELVNRVDRSVTLGSISQALFEMPTTKSRDMFEMIQAMSEYKSNFVLVLSESNEIIGIVTDGDIKRHIACQSETGKVFQSEIDVSEQFISAKSAETVEDLMNRIEIRPALGAIPISDNTGRLISAVNIQTII